LQRFPAGYFALERLLISLPKSSCNTASVEFTGSVTWRSLIALPLKNTVDNELFYPLTLEERAGKAHSRTATGFSRGQAFHFICWSPACPKIPILLVRSIAALNAPDGHLLIVGEGDLGMRFALKFAARSV